MKTAFILLILTLPAFGQEAALPDAPSFSGFVSEHRITLSVFVAATAADAYFTHRNLAGGSHYVAGCRQRPGHPTDCIQIFNGVEFNPIARPVVTRGTPAQVGYFAGLSALTIGGAYLLEKHHHPAAARWLLGIELSSEIAGAGVSGIYTR